MNIVYLSETTGWSGGAEQLLLMARALKDRGHALTIACQPQSEMVARAKNAGVPTALVRMRQDYDVPAAFRVAALTQSLRAEILHAQHSTAHAIGLMAAYLKPVRVFAVTRRVVFPLRRNLFSRLKYLSPRIDGYVAISQAVRAELEKAGIRPERIETIPSVVGRPTKNPDDRRAVRDEFRFAPEDFVITTVANYADFKGQDYLVQAVPEVVKRFPRAHFLLAGRGTETLAPLVQRLGVAKNVHLAGFRTDVARLLSASDLFVLPSLQEAAGTALREAMMAGLPAIGTRVGGIPESIAHEKTGLLVPPADSAALAAAIGRLLGNESERQTLAHAGQAFIEKYFSLDGACQQMETFYTRLLSR
jgi:glycosyltransferase involved in cell wall biosynthesis